MGWKACTLTYRAVAPVLLGGSRMGFIQRTRYFAPGWTLWGAITAQLTRACLSEATGADYEAVGEFVRQNLPTSYASILADGQSAMPEHKDGKLCYGPLPAAEFEARFVTSLGQTGVAPSTATAETASLHETEALSAHDRTSGDRTLWQFTLYARGKWQGLPAQLTGLDEDKILAALETLTLGADRGYGLGLLKREGATTWQSADGDAWPQPLDWDAEGRILRAHVLLSELSGDKVRGRAEAVPLRWWKNDPGPPATKGRERETSWGPGQRRQVRLFYAPGSVVELDGWRPVVGPMGIWQKREG